MSRLANPLTKEENESLLPDTGFASSVFMGVRVRVKPLHANLYRMMCVSVVKNQDSA